MNFLASICIRRPVFATVLTLVMLVFGVVGYLNLGLDRFPKIDFPIITVTTRLAGLAPEEVETEITDKIEEAVNTTSGIDELRSVSSEGISQVFITFVLEKDADVAAQEVRDKVNRILPDLPRDIDQPFVEKFDPDSSPVMTIAVSAPSSIRDLTEYCDKVLRRQLESLPGVGQVLIVGGQARQINVQLDALKMRSHRLTVADVARALQAQNLQVPGGSVKVGRGSTRCGRWGGWRASPSSSRLRWPRTARTPSRSATWATSRTAARSPRASPATTTRRRCC